MQKTLVSARAGTCARASTSAPSAASAAAKTSAGRQMPTTSIAVAPRPPLPLVLLLRKSSNLVARASPSDGDQSGSGSDADASGSGGSGSGSANEGGESLAAREARLAALERGARRGGAARPRSLAASAQQRQQQQQRAAASAASSAAGPADWPEGQLLPSGWERMSAAQKAVELYQGRRGFLFWASQAAWYSVIGVGFGWVLFRFVLPGIGLYKLANGLTDAPTPL